MSILPPSPFIEFAGVTPSPVDEAVASTSAPSPDDAAADQFNSALEAAMPAESAAGPDLSDPPVPAAEQLYGIGPCMIDLPLIHAENERKRAELAESEHRFVLDETAFFEAIEPVPLFLRPVIELLAGY